MKTPYSIGDKVANDHTEEEFMETAMNIECAVTIPVNVELDGLHTPYLQLLPMLL
jgi:hypothetical protein